METEINPSQERVKLNVVIDGVSKTYDVRKGLGLEAIALKYKLPLEFDCRKADCGICSFTCSKDGLSPKTPKEAEYLSALKALPAERLGCQVRVFRDSDIELSTDW